MTTLTVEELKTRAIDFTNLLGNQHDTTSAIINGLLDENFAVQHGELEPSAGGRDAFLAKLGERLKLAQGQVSVQVKEVIAEVYKDSAKGGRCWIYSRKNTPMGSTDSVRTNSFSTSDKHSTVKNWH